MALLGLAAEDDDGQLAPKRQEPKPEPKQAPRSTSSEPAGMMEHHRRVMSAIEEAKAHGLSAQDVREVLGSCGFERVSEIGVSQAGTVIAELAAVAGRLTAA
jgi:hypothetical protein